MQKYGVHQIGIHTTCQEVLHAACPLLSQRPVWRHLLSKFLISDPEKSTTTLKSRTVDIARNGKLNSCRAILTKCPFPSETICSPCSFKDRKDLFRACIYKASRKQISDQCLFLGTSDEPRLLWPWTRNTWVILTSNNESYKGRISRIHQCFSTYVPPIF